MTSPKDILDAIQTGQRAEEQRKQAEKLASELGSNTKIPLSFQEVMMKQQSQFFGPEQAIMKVMDANYQKDEDRRNGKTSHSGLDFLGQATTAHALSGFYSNNPNVSFNLQSDTPFSPGEAIQNNAQYNTGLMKDAVKKAIDSYENVSSEEKDLLSTLFESAFPASSSLSSLYGQFSATSAAKDSPAYGVETLAGSIHPKLAKAVGLRFGKTQPITPQLQAKS
ncbi:MAG: hypothetical protein JKX97_04925 [Candidatus Lindowbacteria bacterium]|nr:hypothetical protein [Candidatus Lindowbacteria bacterium]